jgi:hypothetical protein
LLLLLPLLCSHLLLLLPLRSHLLPGSRLLLRSHLLLLLLLLSWLCSSSRWLRNQLLLLLSLVPQLLQHFPDFLGAIVFCSCLLHVQQVTVADLCCCWQPTQRRYKHLHTMSAT